MCCLSKLNFFYYPKCFPLGCLAISFRKMNTSISIYFSYASKYDFGLWLNFVLFAFPISVLFRLHAESRKCNKINLQNCWCHFQVKNHFCNWSECTQENGDNRTKTDRQTKPSIICLFWCNQNGLLFDISRTMFMYAKRQPNEIATINKLCEPIYGLVGTMLFGWFVVHSFSLKHIFLRYHPYAE